MNRIALVELAGAFLITQADFLQRLLGTTKLSPRQWGLALSAAVVLLAFWESGKWIARRRTKSTPVQVAEHWIHVLPLSLTRSHLHHRIHRRNEMPSKNHEKELEREAPSRPPKMKRKEYEREMRVLHAELVAVQEWVRTTAAKICIVFEGRDTAGKGGTIKRITERVSPRVFRVVALSAPTEREKSQMYVQRYIQHFPAAGEVVIFDRSWYNRAGVEPVMGFCTQEETKRFLDQVPAVEKAMIDSGILLLKYWLEVSADEQTRRLESRINDPRKIWKLSDMDLKSYSRWYDYSRARDAMFAASDTAWAPWYRRKH